MKKKNKICEEIVKKKKTFMKLYLKFEIKKITIPGKKLFRIKLQKKKSTYISEYVKGQSLVLLLILAKGIVND